MLPLSELSARSAAALGAVAARAKGSAAALGAAALTRRRSSLTEDWLGLSEGGEAGGAGGAADGGGEATAGGVAGAPQGEPASRGRPRRALSAGVLGTAPVRSALCALRSALCTLRSAQRKLRTALGTRHHAPAPSATRATRRALRVTAHPSPRPPLPPPRDVPRAPRCHRRAGCRGPTCDAARGLALLLAPPRRTRIHRARLARRRRRLRRPRRLHLRLRLLRFLARSLPG